MSVSNVIALAGLAVTVVIAGLAYAYKSGRTDAELKAIRDTMERDAQSAAAKVVERETRLGAAETAIGVLFAWMNKSKGIREERIRHDTRGVPIPEDEP